MASGKIIRPRYAKTNDPVGPRHDALNPGPENSAYDFSRHEAMKFRTFRYGFFRVGEEKKELLCVKCERPILHLPNALVVNGVPYHAGCFSIHS